MNRQLRDLPDLPGLESVELKNWKGLLFGSLYLWMYLGMLAFPIYGCIKLWRYLDQSAVVIICLLGLLCVWLLLRFLGADIYWKTDSKGLTIKGIIRRRFISWSEVREVHTQRSTVTRESSYKLKTDMGTVTVPSREDSNRKAGCELAASVWQHLRHIGRADGLALSDEALSLWDEIPDALPREIEWHGRSRRGDAIGGVIVVALFSVGIIWMMSQGFGIALMALGMTPAIAFIGLMFYREAFLASESVTLTDSGIEAKTLRRTVSLQWSEVTGARWERSYLVISSSEPHKQVWIEYLRTANDQGKLILAVIRRLRELGAPIAMAVPGDLRAKQDAHDNEPILTVGTDAVELKPTVAERIFGGLAVFLMLGLILVGVYALTNSNPLTLLAGALIYMFGVYAVGSYRYRADLQGVEKWFLWWRRTVRWAEVAKHENWRTHKPQYKKWILRDSRGRKLIDITLDTGSLKDKARFELYLRARLADISPPGALNWLAKPRFGVSDIPFY